MPLPSRLARFASGLVAVASLGCGHPSRPSALPATAQDNVATADAVQVHLYPRDDEQWTLRRADDTYVCTLPCSYWVPPESSLTVRLEGSTPHAIAGLPEEGTAFALPAHLPANPGGAIGLTVDRTHGFGTLGKVVAGSLAVTFGLMGIAFAGLSTASLATGSKNTTTSTSGCVSTSSGGGASTCTSQTTHGVAADIGGLAFGIGALTVATLCAIWFFHDREGGLRYESPPARASAFRVRVEGGAISLDAGRVRTWVSPGGIAGAF